MSSTLTPDSEASVLEAIGSNLPAAADAFRHCFALETCRIEIAGSAAFCESEPDGFDAPGLMLTIDVGGDRMTALIPAAILPDGISELDEETSDRLATFASEWSVALLPTELEADASACRFVENLWLEVHGSEPMDWAKRVDLAVVIDDADTPSTIRLVWPVTSSGASRDENDRTETTPEELPTAAETKASAGVEVRHTSSPSRLAGIAVQLSVRLAEKRIDIRQLVELTPGALLPFDKNCESPLELYVANQRFGLGEAVKIGERFGLKVDAIGTDPM